MVPEGIFRRVTAMLVAVLISCVCAQTALAHREPNAGGDAGQSFYMKINAKLYEKAKTSAQVMARLPMGSYVRLISSDGDWAVIQYEQTQGFVRSSHLSADYPTLAVQMRFPRTAYVTEGTYLHFDQKASSSILRRINPGEEVEVQAIDGRWAKVLVEGQTGYTLESRLTMFSAATKRPEALKPGASGDEVMVMQRRLNKLGYLEAKPTGDYKQMTFNALRRFQAYCGLKPTGRADTDTLFVLFNKAAPQYRKWATDLTDYGDEVSGGAPAAKIINANWWESDIRSVFSVGDTARVTDVRTGIQFQVWRGGGTNHADVQPLTASDTRKMKSACGGWSWARRPIWVSVGGKTYAASMNCMHHGQGSIAGNEFDGHFCIHFTKSRTHGTDRICPVHQACIREALAAGNKK